MTLYFRNICNKFQFLTFTFCCCKLSFIKLLLGGLFQKIEEVARRVRKNDEPFGGIKLILCGDFLQLPPVNKTSKARFCFQTEAWTRCQFLCFNLKKVYRQNDDIFIDILNNIRLGR